MASAAECARWGADETLADLCARELAGLRHLELSHGYHFDRLDEGDVVAASVEGARDQFIADVVIDVAWATWAGGGAVPWRMAEAAAAAVASDPTQYLRRFDLLRRERGPSLLNLLAAAFRRRLGERGVGDEPAFPPDLLRGVARRLARGGRLHEYSWVRPDVLELLSAEAVDPLELAEAAADDPDGRFRQLAAHLSDDLSLRVVWLARRVHGG